jgi:hypothetical protein
MLDVKVGDHVRVKREWNPMAPTRLVTHIDEVTGEIDLDCTPVNGVRVRPADYELWEKLDA